MTKTYQIQNLMMKSDSNLRNILIKCHFYHFLIKINWCWPIFDWFWSIFNKNLIDFYPYLIKMSIKDQKWQNKIDFFVGFHNFWWILTFSMDFNPFLMDFYPFFIKRLNFQQFVWIRTSFNRFHHIKLKIAP